MKILSVMHTFELGLASFSTPEAKVYAAFVPVHDTIFREQKEIQPRTIGNYKYMPWGYDDQLPYNVLDKIEEDETVSACQRFNAEICYSGGLNYNTDKASPDVDKSVNNFLNANNIPYYFMGICQDMKHFDFAITLIILSRDGKSIVNITRKPAMYCRFATADARGRIPYILYANWRQGQPVDKAVERIPLLDSNDPLGDLNSRLGVDSKATPTKDRKFAIVTRVATPDNTYYPIPYYGSLLKSKWYDIKQLIAVAKLAKLKNGASIKYIIAIADGFWEKYYEEKGIAHDEEKCREAMRKFKSEIIDYLSGAENAGKGLFTGCYTDPNSGKSFPEVQITTIDNGKEGGDWETDFAEAVNMACFAMGVHSNLVGSVPGKSQTNNSGSDKRELYTIAQARQKPYHDLMFQPHRLIVAFNHWDGVRIECPLLQLTTLDEHKDVKTSDIDNNNNEKNND